MGSARKETEKEKEKEKMLSSPSRTDAVDQTRREHARTSDLMSWSSGRWKRVRESEGVDLSESRVVKEGRRPRGSHSTGREGTKEGVSFD